MQTKGQSLDQDRNRLDLHASDSESDDQTSKVCFTFPNETKQDGGGGGGGEGGDAKRRLTVNMLWFQAYKAADQTRKFVMRFLMREIINQLSALQRPLEAASDSLDDQARQERSGWFVSCYAVQ